MPLRCSHGEYTIKSKLRHEGQHGPGAEKSWARLVIVFIPISLRALAPLAKGGSGAHGEGVWGVAAGISDIVNGFPLPDTIGIRSYVRRNQSSAQAAPPACRQVE